MKISITQYAKGLYEATKDKTYDEINILVSNFFQLLVKNNQTKLASKIINNFKKIWNEEEGIVEAEIITRYKIQDTKYKQIEEFIKKKYSAEKVIINNILNPNIKGGVIIKVGDEVLDGSIQNQLKNLKHFLIE